MNSHNKSFTYTLTVNFSFTRQKTPKKPEKKPQMLISDRMSVVCWTTAGFQTVTVTLQKLLELVGKEKKKKHTLS